MTNPAPDADSLSIKLAAFWRAHPELAAAPRLLVAVSGGADSLALLHWLVHASGCPLTRFLIAHVDHRLRPDSAADADFVAEQAGRWGVPYCRLNADIPAEQRATSASLETAARRVRYRLLGAAAVEAGAPFVLVAHHADDQAETVLMRLLRGSGLAGLGGMRPFSRWPEPAYPELTLVRPMLDAWREEIDAYLAAHALEPRIDPSNRDLRFTRNRIRHELIPYLGQYNPQIRRRLAQTADLLAADADRLAVEHDRDWRIVIEAEGEDWVRGRRSDWLRLSASGRRAVIRRALRRTCGALQDVTYDHIDRLAGHLEAGSTGQAAAAGSCARVYCYYDTFVVAAGDPAAAFDLPQLVDPAPQPLPAEGIFPLREPWQLRVSPAGAEPTPGQPAWEAVVPQPISGRLLLRGRQPGERLTPAGMAGQSVKIKALMIDRKIPAPLRERWPLVTDGDQILWVAGHRLAEAAVDRPPGRPVIHLRFERRTT